MYMLVLRQGILLAKKKVNFENLLSHCSACKERLCKGILQITNPIKKRKKL